MLFSLHSLASISFNPILVIVSPCLWIGFVGEISRDGLVGAETVWGKKIVHFILVYISLLVWYDMDNWGGWCIDNHSFCMEVISTDWTSSSQAKILSKMSSVKTLSSSITHPIWSFWMPKATSSFFGSLFQVKPSIYKAKILWANSSKLVS